MQYNIEYEKQKVLDEIRGSEPGFEALNKLRYIRENIDWAIEGYRNSLTILSDTTYEDRKHFLMELIQNADDADYGDEIPEIHFYITDVGLELYYNEVGFTVEDIISITDTGASTKKTKKNNATSFIGEKGIGFKSVFALAETVEIHSGSWHFLLGKDQCIVPKPIEGNDIVSGTRQIIRFTDQHVTEEIYKELKRYISGEAETFIYLQKISKFVLIDKRKNSFEKHEIQIIPADRSGDRLTLRIVDTGEEREFLLFSENIHFSADLVASRWEKIGTSLGSVDRKVVLAAAMSGPKLNDQGRLFCYLPTSVTLPIPVYMQVDGVTKADRERLHDPQNNPWNKHLLAELPDVIARAITHWAKTVESVEEYQRLIPVNDGNDQLYYVFFMARRALKSKPWVRIMGEESQWKKPDHVMGFPYYMNRLFQDYPELARKFDKHLNKYILHLDWYNNHYLRKKLEMYGVEVATDTKILNALVNVGLPLELIADKEKLLGLYRYMIEILENKYSIVKNSGESYISRKIEAIKELEIFPVHQLGFTYLRKFKKTYYSLVEGGESMSDNALVIDRAYIKNEKYTEEQYNALSDNEKLDIKFSETLIILLKKLGVDELSDEIMLSDFIIPELKSNIHFSSEERLGKLFSVFDYYKNKINSSRVNRKLLDGMDEIWIFGNDNQLHQLKNLLIPNSVRISAAEGIYDRFGLKQILITPSFKERIGEDKLLFHDFLIECGIRHKPIFRPIKEEHPDVATFRKNDPDRYNLWTERIKNDYTSANRVIVERVELDEIDQKIISKAESTVEYERYLYGLWMEQFQGNEINDYSYYYKGTAIPGYFIVRYMRNERRCVQIKDIDWAGINKNSIPLKKSNGTLGLSSDTFTLPQAKERRLHYLYEHLNGVFREDSQYPQLSYNSLYLETLEVPYISYEDVEVLWKKISENRYEDIIDFISQMISMNISYTDIRILNKSTGKLTKLSKFKLGKVSFDEDPLIEEQYGEAGKGLGELYGLTKGGTIESYKDTITSVMKGSESSEETLRRFMSLLHEWNTYKANEKMIIIEEFNTAVGNQKAPILVLGEQELHLNFERSGIRSILISDELIKADQNLLYKAAGEIGFIMPDNFGKLEIIGKEVISRGLYEKCEKVLYSYVELFEKKEISRLDNKLKMYGGISKVLTHVILGSSAFREEKGSGISYVVKLPYLDSAEKRIILQNTLSEYKIIKEILLIVEFAPKRNIDQDLHEIRKDLERIQRVQENNEKETQGSTETETQERADVEKADRRNSPVDEMTRDREKTEGAEKKPKNEEIRVTQNVDTLMTTMKDKLSGSGSINEESDIASWKIGPDPEEELEIREALVENIASSLNKGPEVYKRKLRDVQRRKKMYKGNELGEDEKLIDKGSIEPKAFLEAEYDCRCQVCGNQIVFDSGKKWISVYHIQDRKEGAWYYDRPFNILGLCPNCYTMAKYSGNRDFSKLLDEAQKVVEGETFAESVDSFGGDYYLVDVVLDNKEYKMKMSKVHMNYFAALVELGG